MQKEKEKKEKMNEKKKTKMKKNVLVFLACFWGVLTAFAQSATFSLEMVELDGSGDELPNSRAFLGSNFIGLTQKNTFSGDPNNVNDGYYLWDFIPVDDLNPGRYHIVNKQTGKYLYLETSGNGGAYASGTGSNQLSQWILIKVDNDKDLYKLITVQGFTLEKRAVVAMGGTAATVGISYSPNGTVFYLRVSGEPTRNTNADMELITYATPPTYTGSDPFGSGSGGAISLPPVLGSGNKNGYEFTSPHLFPVGYKFTGNAYGVFGHQASGGHPEDGLSFSRLYQGATMEPMTRDSYSENRTIEIGFWARAFNGTGTETTMKVGEIEVRKDPSNPSLVETVDIEIETSNTKNKPAGWIYVTAVVSGVKANSTVNLFSIKNTMAHASATLDIDDLNWESAVLYEDNNSSWQFVTRNQSVPSFTKVIYTYPRTTVRDLTTLSPNLHYYRWYELDDDGTKITNFPFTQPSSNGHTKYHTAEGIIYRVPGGESSALHVGGYQATYRTPSNLPTTIACDISLYRDFIASGEGFEEPTLSYRNFFEFRSAYEIAAEIDSRLADNSVYEYYHITTVPAGYLEGSAVEQLNHTQLRLSPKYDALNYYYTNYTGSSIQPTTEATLSMNYPGILLNGTSFKWVRSASPSAIYTITPDESGNPPAGITPLVSGTDGITLLQDGDKSLNVNTSSKSVGNIEYFDVYVVPDVDNAIWKLVARFEIKYESVHSPSNFEDPKSPRIGVGPVDLLAMENLVGEHIFDENGNEDYYIGRLLHGINKRVVATLNFDQLNSTDPKTKLGTKSLDINHTSYGFVDPVMLNKPGTLHVQQKWSNSNRTEGVHWSEYAFPQVISDNGALTGLHWWDLKENTDLYDITYLKNKLWTGVEKKGNMLFVDAAMDPGTFATLEFTQDLCTGTTLYFSAFVANTNFKSAKVNERTEDRIAGRNSTIYRPNMIFILKEKISGKELRRFYTGDIGRGDSAGKWQEVAFSFEIVEGTESELILEIKNNGLGSEGNDFALDEIRVFRGNPAVKTVRETVPLCLPDSESAIPDNMYVGMYVDLTQMTLSSEATHHPFYYRLIDSENRSFPQTSLQTVPVNVYSDAAHTPIDAVDTYYGSYDLSSVRKLTEAPAKGDLNPYILYLGDNPDDPNNWTTFFFRQVIPVNVMNVKISDEGPFGRYRYVTGLYTLYFGESVANMCNESCGGMIKFPVQFDDTELRFTSETGADVTNAVCPGDPFDVTAYSYFDMVPAVVYYDWFHGTEEEFNAYTVGVNSLASDLYNMRRMWGTYDDVIPPDITSQETMPPHMDGTVQNANALLARLRAAIGTGRGQLELSKRMLRSITLNSGEDYPLLIVPCAPGAKQSDGVFGDIITDNVHAVAHLVDLRRDASGNPLIQDGRYVPLIDPVTKEPILQKDANGDPIRVAICTRPIQLQVPTILDGPSVSLGEVNEKGEFLMEYPHTNPDYIYTVRLPEKNFVNGNTQGEKVKSTTFVLPLNHFNDVKSATVIYKRTMLNGTQINAVERNIPSYIGVIDNQNPNKLDQSATVTISQMPDPTGTGAVSTPSTTLKTYWSLTETSIGGVNLSLLSYPLIHNKYNYYYANGPEEDANGLRVGRPYPTGSRPEATATPVANNRIGIEIPVGPLSSAIKEGSNFIPNAIYEFVLEVKSGGSGDCEVKEIPFRMIVIPEQLYWSSASKANDSWHNDKDWEYNNSGRKSSFAPLRPTDTRMEKGATVYPTLNDETVRTVNDYGVLIPGIKETGFIEFDYNFKPNSTDKIHFEMSSELGNQFYLDYGKASVDLELNTARWYGLSAPLRNMYSGDYMFERANPLVQMRHFNTVNPQTQASFVDWTTPFHTINVELTGGLPYSVMVAKIKYKDSAFDADPTVGVADYANPSSMDQITEVNYSFPGTKMDYDFYDEVTKKLLDPSYQQIPAGGRNWGHRFVYEVTEGTESVVKENANGNLLTISTGRDDEAKTIVVGNPFMSHLDFEAFYEANQAIIKPEYKIVSGIKGNVFATYSAVDNGGVLLWEASTDGLTKTSIPPMQSFIVETREGYDGNLSQLVFNKEMSTVNTASKLRADRMADMSKLKISISNGTETTNALLLLYNEANDNYSINEDSRAMLLKEDQPSTPRVFTVVNNMSLDINRMSEFPTTLPIGLLVRKGALTLGISDANSLYLGSGNLYLVDTETGLQTLIDSDKFEYKFNSDSSGELLNRFYLLRKSTGFDTADQSSSVVAYVQQNELNVVSLDGSPIQSVSVVKSDGQTFYQQNQVGTSHLKVPVSLVPNTVLIVRTTTDQATTTVKVLNK